MRSTKLTFTGSQGTRIAARIDEPDGETRAHALFAHCFTCSKDLKAVNRIARRLAEREIAVLRFDFTGLGESEGDFADTNFTTNLQDLLAAVQYMRTEHQAPRILIGHSLGGAAVLAVGGQVPEVVGVATIGAPSETAHLASTLAAIDPALESRGEVEVSLGGRPVRIKQQLLDDLEEHRLRDSIANLGRALLVMHSPIDETVGIEHARRIFEAAKHPKSFVSLDGADHLLLARERDAQYVAEVLSVWAGRYVEAG